MLDNEAYTVARQFHVAPCLNCGATDIRLMHCNHELLNYGGGECVKCERRTFGSVERDPAHHDLASIWNACNDIEALIRAEQGVILKAKLHIALLQERLTPDFRPLDINNASQRLMHAEEFLQCERNGVLPCKGCGVWATDTHRSNVYTGAARPTWATHVVWYC